MTRTAKITVGFALYIIISASFMRQVRTFLVNIFGEGVVNIAFLSLAMTVAACYILYLIFYIKLSWFRIVLSAGVLFLAYDLIMRQPYFSEKLHVLEYGILGYLALLSFSEADTRTLKNIALSLIFVTLTGALDEGFQKILPYRVFDLRDIVTNVASGGLGIALELIRQKFTLPPEWFKKL